MAQPLKGGQPTTDGKPAPSPQQPQIIDNPSTSRLAQALKQSQAQFDKAK